MVAKRPSQALALLLALPSAAFALGLGDIHLLSPLNSPLDAEIELVDVAPDEVNTMQAQLASRDTFARYGLDYPAYLSGVQLRTARTADGRQIIKLKSSDAISDPVIKLLVEVNWARGHLVREYTVMVDPSVQSHGQSPVASAASEGSTHVVRRGETLSRIAASVSGADVTSAHARSWMLAIYQANPHAFEKNMNLLHSGAVLRIPDAATAAAVSPSEASAEIRRQYAAWRGAAAPAESAAAAATARLKLVTPSESASTGAPSGTQSGEVAALQGQLHDLQSQVAAEKRLLEVKDAELARLQAQLATKQGANAAAPAPGDTPPAAVASPAVAAKPPVPVAQRVPPSSSGSRDTLARYWWVLLILLGVAGLVGRFLRARRASQFDDSLGRLAVAGAGVDPRPAGTALGAAATGATDTFEHGFAADDAPLPAAAPPLQEAAFLVEETGSHDAARPAVAAAAATPTAPGYVASDETEHAASDETITSETAINLDQGDPLAEADFHMAYGLYDQAADLTRIGIGREPARRDLKLKLLEVFFVSGNKEPFLQSARELAETRAEAAPGEWEKILIMGKQLAPEDPLFSGSGAVTGAAAGGLDVDLEGGQSRVDFDLLEGPTVEQPALSPHDNPTIPALLESALRADPERTADVGIDALGLDVGMADAPMGAANGSHGANGAARGLDVDTAIVPDTAFGATQRLPSEDLTLSDLEPVTLSEVGTKLDLARAYMDMGDPEGARNILEEVLTEGSATQRQEARRLIEALP